MSCWAWCGLRHFIVKPFAKDALLYATASSIQLDWLFHFSQDSNVCEEVQNEHLIVRTISGAEVACLSPRAHERALDVKRRIQKQVGTSFFMQKLIQGGHLLKDADIVTREPLVLVRVPRKRILIASSLVDLSTYDMETGATIQSVNLQHLQIACMIVDWVGNRCFTGSIDGSIRVWDIYANECLGTLPGLPGRVTAISCGRCENLLAVAEHGNMRIWSLDVLRDRAVIAKKSKEWQVELYGNVLLSVDWEHFVALVSGRAANAEHLVSAYSLQTRKRLWLWTLRGATPTLLVHWAKRQCIVAPRCDCLELRGIYASAGRSTTRCAHHRIHPKALFNVDWSSARIVFITQPFGVELWSLLTFDVLYSMRGMFDCDHLVSLDVDWGDSHPRAITCHVSLESEPAVGRVVIRNWDIQEEGDVSCVETEHPIIIEDGVVIAVAQI